MEWAIFQVHIENKDNKKLKLTLFSIKTDLIKDNSNVNSKVETRCPKAFTCMVSGVPQLRPSGFVKVNFSNFKLSHVTRCYIDIFLKPSHILFVLWAAATEYIYIYIYIYISSEFPLFFFLAILQSRVIFSMSNLI